VGSYKPNKCQTIGATHARATVCFFAAFLAASVWIDCASAAIPANLQPVSGVPDLLRDPNSYTIQEIINAGGILIGDKLFSNFDVKTTKSVGAVAPGADAISITPIQVLKAGTLFGGDYGMQFNGLWSAPAQGLADSTIEFLATIVAPGYAFKDNALWITGKGVGSSVSPGFVSISESLYAEHPSTGIQSFADELVYYSTPTYRKDSDSANFAPITKMWVVKDVGANGGIGVMGVAHLSEFYQTFSQVPEPGTLVMLFAGAAGLAGYVWRRRRA
jgi:hypothetical protein